MKHALSLILTSAGFLATSAQAQLTEIYSNDFEGIVGGEWSDSSTDVTPTGRGFLGRFTNEDSIDLSLGTGSTLYPGGLPPHSEVTISFALFIIHSWDGGSHGDFWGLDQWDESLILTSFANPLNGTAANLQHFPGDTSDPLIAARSGAIEEDSLGYWSVNPTRFGDAVYEMTFTFDHSADSLRFRFFADGFYGGVLPKGIGDESWGLDNVSVSIETMAIPEPSFLPGLFSILIPLALIRNRRS